MYGANTDVVEGAKAVRTVSTLSSRCEAIGNSGTHILAYGGNNTSGPIEVATACNTRERFDFETETLVTCPVVIPINTQLGLRGAETSNTSREGVGIGNAGDPSFTLQSAHSHAVASIACPVADSLTVGASQTYGFSGDIIAHTLRGEGFDSSEDGTGRGTPLVVSSVPQPQSFDWQAGVGTSDKSRTCIHDTPGRTRALTSCKTLAVTVFDSKSTGVQNSEDISPTLRSMNSAQNHPNAGGQLAIAFGWQNSEHQGDSCSESVTPTLDKSKTPAVMASSAVRRLTPKECERLQGFPDNWTWIPEQNRRKIEEDYYAYILLSFPDMSPEEAERLSKDGPRYKALGNAFAVPVVRWIAKRLVAEIKRSEESC